MIFYVFSIILIKSLEHPFKISNKISHKSRISPIFPNFQIYQHLQNPYQSQISIPYRPHQIAPSLLKTRGESRRTADALATPPPTNPGAPGAGASIRRLGWHGEATRGSGEPGNGDTMHLMINANPGFINHGLLIGGYFSNSHNLILEWYLPNETA